MYEQGKALMGDTAPLEQEPAPEPEGPLTKDDIAQMIREGLQAHSKQTDEERRIQEQIGRVKAETETLGFGPSHPLHGALLLTAKSNEVSLAEAAELLKQGGGVASSESNTQDAPDESGRTPVPPEGVTPAGTQRVVDPKKAAIERLSRTLPEGQRGFADV